MKSVKKPKQFVVKMQDVVHKDSNPPVLFRTKHPWVAAWFQRSCEESFDDELDLRIQGHQPEIWVAGRCIAPWFGWDMDDSFSRSDFETFVEYLERRRKELERGE